MPRDEQRRSRWTSTSRLVEWSADERTYADLLDALTRERLEAETTEREMDAPPAVSLADVQEQQRRTARIDLAEARRELLSFRAALDDARARSGPEGTAEVAYDSADPEQDDRADLLIQHLVRTGYADVRTEERDSGRYVYHIRVDWSRLRALARELAHPLEL